MSTKITTPELFNLSSNNTEATQLPVFTTSTRPTPTTSTVQVEYLVVAGGGGGGAGYTASTVGTGGGGGAGGLITNYGGTSLSLNTSTAYTITVGDGGNGGAPGGNSFNGGDSTFSGTGITTIQAAGGGRGGMYNNSNIGGSGGSGGGTGYSGGFAAGGSGNTPSTTPSQGNDGGDYYEVSPYGGSGGGGAGSAGSDGPTNVDGGSGVTNSITGTSVFYAAGGGGGKPGTSGTQAGGSGIGGDGGNANSLNGTSGATNTGSGGGGAGHPFASSSNSGTAGDGGSGIVILRYPTNSSPIIKTTGSLVYTESTDGSDTVLQFTEGSGNVSFASAGIAVGEMIFNSTTEKVEYWDGFQWNMIKDEAVAPSIEPNQILWLDANNANSWTGSGSTWFDVSGNGYDATITTAVPSTGTVNGATYLNIPSSSRADYFKIPYSTHSGALNMNSSSVITWLYWMRLPNIPISVNGLNVVLKSTATGATQNQVYFRYYDPSIEGFNTILYDANYNAAINPGYIAPVNNTDWFMFVAIFNFPANNFQFHRYQPNTTTYNNTALGNVSPQNTNNNDIYLLSEPASIYGGYGELGEIRAYNTTFTISEITAKYNAQKGKYGIT